MKEQREASNSGLSKTISRRAAIKRAAALAAGTAASGLASPMMVSTAEAQAPSAPYVPKTVTVVASPSKNVVETDSGEVFGYSRDDLVMFKGIPYGASTAGKNRFMPPVKPTPWAGVRNAMYWGPEAPQPGSNGHSSEDCLRINVWTPSINDNAKRPVMMWIPGGGFISGSAEGSLACRGGNLVRRGDVVVVNLDHRIGILGYAGLTDYGEQYASSVNVGMLDLVAALEWVKTNISNFGGDPNKVLIFGQSGGGSKVSVLMAMPSAKGLFHRAVVESAPVHIKAPTADDAASATAPVLAELGLTKSSIGKIHELPANQIVEAAVHAQPNNLDLGWGPAVDGKILPRQPWDPTAPPDSADVPTMLGSTLNEIYTSIMMGNDPGLESMTMAEVRRRLKVGENVPGSANGSSFHHLHANLSNGADHVIEVFQKAQPDATPFTILSIISATVAFRMGMLTMAARKAAQGAAPVYNYWFQWQTPILDGRPRASHGSEIPFVFYNTEKRAIATGGGANALDLAGRMADAWINFARNGDPNHPGLPHWPAYDAAKIPTMIFDTKCAVENDPDGEVRKAIVEAIAPQSWVEFQFGGA